MNVQYNMEILYPFHMFRLLLKDVHNELRQNSPTAALLKKDVNLLLLFLFTLLTRRLTCAGWTEVNWTVLDLLICVFVFWAVPAGEAQMKMMVNNDEELFSRGSMKNNVCVCVCEHLSLWWLCFCADRNMIMFYCKQIQCNSDVRNIKCEEHLSVFCTTV